MDIPEIDVPICTKNGESGLHLTAIHDTEEIAKILVAKGCPMDAKDHEVCHHLYLQCLTCCIIGPIVR